MRILPADNVELGTACGKLHRVSVLAITDPGEPLDAPTSTSLMLLWISMLPAGYAGRQERLLRALWLTRSLTAVLQVILISSRRPLPSESTVGDSQGTVPVPLPASVHWGGARGRMLCGAAD